MGKYAMAGGWFLFIIVVIFVVTATSNGERTPQKCVRLGRRLLVMMMQGRHFEYASSGAILLFGYFKVGLSDFGKITARYSQQLAAEAIPFEDEKHTEELILNADEVIKSPGIPPTAPIMVKGAYTALAASEHYYPFHIDCYLIFNVTNVITARNMPIIQNRTTILDSGMAVSFYGITPIPRKYLWATREASP